MVKRYEAKNYANTVQFRPCKILFRNFFFDNPNWTDNSSWDAVGYRKAIVGCVRLNFD